MEVRHSCLIIQGIFSKVGHVLGIEMLVNVWIREGNLEFRDGLGTGFLSSKGGLTTISFTELHLAPH